MAKGKSDLILRDRMQFTFDATGNRTTLYGRIDLSDYVNTVDKKGLSIKEVRFQIRDPDGLETNTGVWTPVGQSANASGANAARASLKLYATTRAYENASDVGISSPDVIAVHEQIQIIPPQLAANADDPTYTFLWNDYGTPDLHPEGFTVVSDLLIGIAADGWTEYANQTLEVDCMLIAEPVSVTVARMNEILTQAQDL
tara:strand:+ start:444 stop:1043 length:600 start_codon:yes stop_codon:yes gene_type:complete